MAIRSPYNSFVDFNEDVTTCKGKTRQAALPVYDNYGIKFQIKVEEELLPLSEVLYAGVCTEDCEVVADPNVHVMPMCNRFKFMGTGSVPITPDLFPLTVGNYAPVGGQPQIPAGNYDLPSFLQAVSDAYQIQIDSLDFYDCCSMPTISGIVVFYNQIGSAKSISLQQFWGYGFIDFPEQDILEFGFGDCFRYCILDSEKNSLACSSLFYRESDPCYTSVITYYNEENGYEFRYMVYDDDGTQKITQNKVRLPFYLRRPSHQITENIFTQANGQKTRTSTRIEKDWLGTVGYLSIEQHDRLVVALKHDVVIVDNDFSGLNARMTQEGEYTIGWPDEMNVSTAPAEFRISDYRVNNVNNNCGFNCGVEFVEDCAAPGSGGTTCPDKYQIEFTVGGAEMSDGDTVYQDDNIKGKVGVEVYREGLFQHPSGVNTAVYNPALGTITFTPAVSAGPPGERISIVEI